MSRLSGYPAGLLSLLGSQNFGQTPNELGQMIVPIVDLTGMYGQSKQSFETVAPGNAVNGVTSTVFQVPVGETWILNAADVRMAPGAATGVDNFALVLSATGPTGTAVIFASSFVQPAAVLPGDIAWATLRFPGIRLPPGSGIGYYAEGVVGAVPVFVSIAATRLRI